MKKKLLSLALAAVMVMSLSATALAEGEVTSSATVVKTVTGANAPEETYNFTIATTGMSDTPSKVETQPTVTVEGIKTGTGSASATLDLSNITEIGIYNYTISETIPTQKTAGISYDEKTTYTLKVTAYLDTNGKLAKSVSIKDANGNKVENAAFENNYIANALTVTKNVTGNLGDTTKEFSFTVTFANENDAIAWVNAITYNETETGAADVQISGNKVTFTLSDGDSITFSNIPSGIEYTVTEASYSNDGYTTKINGIETCTTNGTMNGEDVSVTVVNDKNETVDTGVNLDTLPYIMILAVVLIGAAYMVFRKRMSDRY